MIIEALRPNPLVLFVFFSSEGIDIGHFNGKLRDEFIPF